MKNGMKKTAAVVMAAMLMGTGAVVPAAEDMWIFSQTAIVAEAASVGKVTGLKSKTLSFKAGFRCGCSECRRFPLWKAGRTLRNERSSCFTLIKYQIQ